MVLCHNQPASKKRPPTASGRRIIYGTEGQVKYNTDVLCTLFRYTQRSVPLLCTVHLDYSEVALVPVHTTVQYPRGMVLPNRKSINILPLDQSWVVCISATIHQIA